MRLAPEVEAAGRIEWQFFATLTFRGQVPRPAMRLRALQVWLSAVAAASRVPFPRLIWFARDEQGEIGGRHHFHVLIAGMPSSLLTLGACYWLGSMWSKGFSDVRLWVPALGGVDYTLKGLGEDGANCYEARKFVCSSGLILSESLAVVAATGDNVDRECAKHSDNPSDCVLTPDNAGYVQRDPSGLVERLSQRLKMGYILAANASDQGVTVHHSAAITGAL